MKAILLSLLTILFLSACQSPDNQPVHLSLNGDWRLGVSADINEQPGEFTTKVAVPGLVDLAVPEDRSTNWENRIYWHLKEFQTTREAFDLCLLKINKAKYQTWVFVNGQAAGHNPCNFTPTELDITEYLSEPGTMNELLIAVGCWKDLPDTVADGNDFEKDYYIPGIYDEVSVTFTGYPYINNIQCIPEPEEEMLRIRTELTYREKASRGRGTLEYIVRELESGRRVATGQTGVEGELVEFEVPMTDCRLWTPEDPFLYELELITAGDHCTQRFGMRSFRFDAGRKIALLNGKPYYMRGTNVCIYRFFDDPARKDLPWRDDWIITLHKQFKKMHWNSMRYCIGFPPERWYEVADSLGFLIADEFPIWYGSNPATVDSLDKDIQVRHLAAEYEAWMRERWNHPSVVIWDAQNESVTPLTGDALQKVRHLDLSDRPWENGWAAPRSDSDPIETHPYLYSRHYRRHKLDPAPGEMLEYFYDTIRIPHNGPNERDPAKDGSRYENPVIINEYCWLWINRDGSPTRLSEPVYENAFGPGLSSEQMLDIYGRHLALQTEYWRAYRKAAAVKHFCGLGYSRPEEPRGETSDHWADIDRLVYESHFEKYVRPAFAPVGLMLEVWDQSFAAGSEHERRMFIINDLEEPWEGTVTVFFEAGEKHLNPVSFDLAVLPYESKPVEISFALPAQPGTYDLVASIEYNGETIRSIRQISVY